MDYNVLKIENSETIYTTGDIHGDFRGLGHTIKQYDLNDCSIIVCGDIGIGFEKEEFYVNEFNKWEKLCNKRNVHIILIRGNHDNPSYFDGMHFIQYKNIHVVKDYTVVNACDRNILCVGGATSIDRYMRINTNMINEMKYKQHHQWESNEEVEKKSKKVYWEGEKASFNDIALIEIKEAGITLNGICTHTAPDFVYPFDKGNIEGWLALDANLDEDLKIERKLMTELYTQLVADGHKIKVWCYGHFHMTNIEVIDDTKFVLLDMSRDGNVKINEMFRK